LIERLAVAFDLGMSEDLTAEHVADAGAYLLSLLLGRNV
jgi:hypothetical protein